MDMFELDDVAWLMLMFIAWLPLWYSQRDYEVGVSNYNLSIDVFLSLKILWYSHKNIVCAACRRRRKSFEGVKTSYTALTAGPATTCVMLNIYEHIKLIV